LGCGLGPAPFEGDNGDGRGRRALLINFGLLTLLNVPDRSKKIWRATVRTIEIDTEVFSRIWAHRLEGEETENEILRRLLGSARQKARSTIVTKQPAEEPAVAAGARAKWRDDIMQGLTELGGTAALGDIYMKVRAIRRRAGRSLPPSTEAVIRRELENNSSDSDSFTHDRDWFSMPNGKGAGIWSIRR
jgi:hypothetical protein